MIMYFGALSVIPIAEAGAGLFTAPIFVLIISSFYFKVKIGIWRILAVVNWILQVYYSMLTTRY